MESRVSLALAEKLRRMFERDDTFLTFPLGMGFTYRYLSFMKDPASGASNLTLQEQLANKADFARLLNIVPADSPLFANDPSQPLWARMVDVLNAAVFAQSALTPAEETKLAQAIDFLTDLSALEDGTQVPVNSPALNRYYEYKSAFDQAEANYLDEKITVESSSGPEGDTLRQRWTAYREKQLVDAKNQAFENWKNLGFMEQVKSAQQVRNELEPKKYLNLYRQQYLNDIAISEVPDLNGVGLPVCPTFFSPFDAFEPTLPWNKVTLTRTELASLMQSASSELKAMFNGAEGSDDFESVSLEYTNVVVIRPWYRPEFLASRYWKLGDATVVSNGALPRAGNIPGYITSMLVTRNVIVTRKRARPAGAPDFVLPLLSKVPIATLKAAQMPKVAAPATAVKARPAVKLAAAARPTPVAMRAAFVAKPVASKAVAVKTSFVLAQPMLLAKQPKLQASYLHAKYAGITIKAQPCLPPPPAKPEPQPELVIERYGFDGVIVLAFVCKRVPRSPNPDPSLTW